jgi:hypothetical protein
LQLLFSRDILLVCEQENLLGETFFALNELKLASNASKRLSGTLSDICKKKEKIEQRVKRLLEEQLSDNKEDGKIEFSQKGSSCNFV